MVLSTEMATLREKYHPRYPACFEKFLEHLSQGCANDLAYYLEIGPVAKQDREAVFEYLLLEKRKDLISKGNMPDATDFVEKYPEYRKLVKTIFVRGQKFGNAIATGFLSEGGMGEIYTGYHSFGAVRKRCVIKVTRQDAIQEQFQSTRHSEETFEAYRKEVDEVFGRELEITAYVSDNPLVVQAHSTGSFTSSAGREEKYLILEFIDGLNLLELKKRYENEIKEPLGAGAICQIIYQVAKGLQHLHTKIIHLDIKPHNLMVTLKGARDDNDLVKILDYGIANLKEGAPGVEKGGIRDGHEVISVTRIPLTDAGFTVLGIGHGASYKGTPHYSPFEQFIDISLVDQTADLYALGCSMYQLLDKDGMPPFPLSYSDNNEFRALKNAHQMDNVPEIKRPDCGKVINQIIQKLTHKKIPERYHSAKELMADLEKVRKPIQLQNVINRLNGEEEIAEPKESIFSGFNPFRKRTRL